MSTLSLADAGALSPWREVARGRAFAARTRPAAFGPDIDPSAFAAPGVAERVASLRALERQIGEAAALAGIDQSEVERAASYFQVDESAIYQRIQRAYEGQLELMTTAEALRRHEWLRDYWWQAVAVDADRYTAAAELAQTGGFFLRVFAGQRVDRPIQACLLVRENNVSQNVHNLIVVEEGAEAQLVTGCTLRPGVATGLHIGVTEIFLARGATLADTMIHNWAAGFHVRPRTGVVAEEDATFVSNYVLLNPVRSVQSEPRIVLRGRGARAQLRSILVGRGESSIDVGAHLRLAGHGTQAEVLSRAVARDQAEVFLRGLVVADKAESRAHVDCRGMLLSDTARIHAIPALAAEGARRSALSHEAAVGPIADEAVEYLMTRGIRRDDAVAMLVRGFLRLDLPFLPPALARQIDQVLATTEDGGL